MKKQEAMRSAPNEQCDHVSDGGRVEPYGVSEADGEGEKLLH